MSRFVLILLLFAAACGDAGGVAADSTEPPPTTIPATTVVSPPAPTSTTSGTAAACAHVIDGAVEWTGDTATVSATVRSADTGWDKYADAWEARTPGGDVLGVRELAHPHETEQPFTRSLTGVTIPAEVSQVILAARDSVDGWCGDTFTLLVPNRP